MTRLSLVFALLLITVSARAQDIAKYGLPDTGDVHRREGYLLGYDGRLRGARWTLELLTKKSLAIEHGRDNLGFHEDTDVLQEARSRLRDYDRSGYDIGHMAPAGNHCRTVAELKATFLLSNAHPQLPDFNRGPWNGLEGYIRKLAKSDDVSAVWCLTGPLWICDSDQLMVRYLGASEIPVATHFFKSILIEHADGTLEPKTWIVPHVKEPPDMETLLESIDYLENKAGFDVWPELDEALETKK